MVFPSVPVYLDPPNWPQQQPNQHPGLGIQNPQLPPPPSQPLPPPTVGGGSGGHSIRPGSMTDRARLAQLPLPDAALKCPRCESTNTKFCYYNNYSLSQPRHFCKTCRRYWTRGGALRNVPVGGGCRRNKRSKGSNRSKSPAKADRQGVSASTSAHSHSFSNCTSDIISHLPTPAISQLPFLTSTLHNFNDHYGDIGLHFGAIPPPVVATTGGSDAEFQIGTSSSVGSLLSNGLIDQQWRLPNLQQVHHHQQLQLPLLSNYETPIGLFQFEGENVEPPSHVAGDGSGRLQSKTGISGLSQLTTVKMEENQGLSLSRNITGSGNGQFWTGGGSNAWNDIPSFTSSTSHLL